MVEVIVTGTVSGVAPVVPYSHEGGLQFYVTSTGVRTNRPVIYEIPTYEVETKDGDVYDAVRFGLRNRNENPTPDRRPCDAGLSQARVSYPRWVEGYSPHSFNGTSRAGAWQLIPHKGFLIHEGANRKTGQVGGSIGCVEILDGRWNGFLDEIERIAGATCARIGAASKLKVTLVSASYPTAKRRL